MNLGAQYDSPHAKKVNCTSDLPSLLSVNSNYFFEGFRVQSSGSKFLFQHSLAVETHTSCLASLNISASVECTKQCPLEGASEIA